MLVSVTAITSKKKEYPLKYWIGFFIGVTVLLIAALGGLIFMLCECQGRTAKWIRFI